MNTYADKTQKNKSHSVANTVSQKKSGVESTFQFVDNRPEAVAQRKLQEMANDSQQVKQAAQLQAMADSHSAHQQQPIQKKENNTGLSDNLKSGIENLSGYTMDDVKAHYNSDKPAQFQAHAHAQGTDIHIASGQEKHLPHEAWHVVQQKQGRVKPTMQIQGKVNVNDDIGLEKEADMMGGKARKTVVKHPKQILEAKNLEIGDSFTPIQMRSIPNLISLKQGIKQKLDTGDPSHTVSKNSKNVKNLTTLYTPGTSDEDLQSTWLARTVGNNWREGWFDRVDQRVQDGSQRTIGDAQFWAQNIKDDQEAENVEVSSIELLGDELHDTGLGPAKVWFLIEQVQTPPRYMSAVIKPEDRSIEKAILGSQDSIATNLNQQVGRSRRVKTLNMDTDVNHGTIMEFVSSSITSMVETVLRKLTIFESEDTVNVETIGLALLTGLYDLHDQNVMKKGGSPMLIDADVATRPQELINGPSDQAGFKPEQTQQVRGQIQADRSHSSQILQYAIDNPDLVIGIVTNYIGNHRARIVPVHTGNFIWGLRLFVHDCQNGDPVAANRHIERLVRAVPNGIDGSPGLIGELGVDVGNFWNFQFVESAIKRDFDKGVVPHFQYQPSTGQVFIHGTCIWQGMTLAQAMGQLRNRLIAAQ